MARRSFKPKKIIGPHAFEAKTLKSFAERLERIRADIAALKEDEKSVLFEADARGFHKKLVKQVVAEAAKQMHKFRPEQECLALYRDALGILADTPLGLAAQERDTKPKRAKRGIGDNSKPFQEDAA